MRIPTSFWVQQVIGNEAETFVAMFAVFSRIGVCDERGVKAV